MTYENVQMGDLITAWAKGSIDLGNNAVNIDKSIDRIEQKLEQFDERVRRVEIKQAYFEAKFVKLETE